MWLRLTNGGPARQMQGRAVWCRVEFFSSKVHTATCAASQRSNLKPQASAAPPLTRPCPRGVTQLARLAPIARTDRPREHSARQARRVPARTSHRQRSATPALLAILRGWLAKQLRKIDLQPPGGPVIADGVQVVPAERRDQRNCRDLGISMRLHRWLLQPPAIECYRRVHVVPCRLEVRR